MNQISKPNETDETDEIDQKDEINVFGGGHENH
jgi:hypothetical protein